MPELTVTLVDHTPNTSDHFKSQLLDEFAKLLEDLLYLRSEPTIINIRWMRPTPPPDQDLVIHWVQDVSSSYIFQQLGHRPGNVNDGGFTASNRGMRGSEVYRRPRGGGHLSALGFAKLAAHEAMHNMTRLGNAQLHGRGGLADSPPQLPVTDDNRQLVQAALGNLPDQLL